MKKLSLNLDDLSIDTFATVPEEAAARGTVHGLHSHDAGCWPISPSGTMCHTCAESCQTCFDHTCIGTCADSCWNSCTCETQYASCAWTCQETTPC